MTESPSPTIIRTPTDPPIIDVAGNVWRLAPGNTAVLFNGTSIRGPFETIKELVYVGRSFYLLDGENCWWRESVRGGDWDQSGPPPPPPAPPVDPIWTALNTLAEGIHVLMNVTSQILGFLMRDFQPTSVMFAVPSFNSNGKFLPMAVMVFDDVQSIIPLIFKNHAGMVIPLPVGIVGTVSNDTLGSFTAALSPDGSSVLVDPMKPPVAGATGILTYTGVLAGKTLTCQIDLVTGADTVAAEVEFDPTNITTAPLP